MREPTAHPSRVTPYEVAPAPPDAEAFFRRAVLVAALVEALVIAAVVCAKLGLPPF